MYNKIITLSFDDGENYDVRVAQLLRKYGLKATFYLCSGHIGLEGDCCGGKRHYIKLSEKEIKKTYDGFEIGAHGDNHGDFTAMAKNEIFESLNNDLRVFSEYTNIPIVCCAYPGGSVNEQVIRYMEELGVVSFARTIPDEKKDFSIPEHKFNCKPTAHIFDSDIYETIKEFEKLNDNCLSVLHIYGHSYEIEALKNGWTIFEKLLKSLSELKEVDFLTNGEAYALCFE